MSEAKPSRCFFMHVMKTGGTTFLRRLKSFFAANERYPFLQGEERRLQYTMLDELRKLGPEQRASLRHFRRGSAQYCDAPVEALYEHPLIFPLFVHDYQAKLFAMHEADNVQSHRDVIDVDAHRLRIAKENLERVDVVGLAHRHDQFLEQLRDRFGWRLGPAPDQRVSTEGWDVSQSFRDRIAGDNPADMEFYEYALALHERRRCR